MTKKVVALMAVLSLFAAPLQPIVPAFAADATLFSDGFELGDFTEWTSVSGTWKTVTNGAGAHSGNKRADVIGTEESILVKEVNTTGYEDIEISLYHKDNGFEIDDVVYVEYTEDGSTWKLISAFLDDQNEASDWTLLTISLPSEVDDNANFAFRFRAKLGTESDKLSLDDVEVTGTEIEDDTATTPISFEKVDFCYISGELLEFTLSFQANDEAGRNSIVMYNFPAEAATPEVKLPSNTWFTVPVPFTGGDEIDLSDLSYDFRTTFTGTDTYTGSVDFYDTDSQQLYFSQEITFSPCDDDSEDDKITICHQAGNSGNWQEIEIDLNAWDQPNGHGGHENDFIVDDENPCPPGDNEPEPEPDMCTAKDSMWAYEVTFFEQGDRKDGSGVVSERSDTNKALGEAENDDTINFAALGFGGEIVVKSEVPFPNGTGDDIQIFETTFGNETDASYPESADVYVSQYGSEYKLVGSVGVNGGTLDIDGVYDWAQYVKIVDTSDKANGNFPATADGFDVDAVKFIHCGQDDDGNNGGGNPDPEPTNDGMLRICKILLDEDGEIVTGDSIDATFEITVTGPDSFEDIVTFTTPMSYTMDTLTENDADADAECIELTGLAGGEYQYAEEVITSSTIFDTAKYNDQFDENVKDLLDFYEFAADGSDNDNDNNDGIINVPEKGTRELIVLNRISDENPDDNGDEEPPTVDLDVNGEESEVTVTTDEDVTLTWTVTNADSCEASGNWSEEKAPFDSSTDLGTLPEGTYTYMLECENGDGETASDTVTVTVVAITEEDNGGPSGGSGSSGSSTFRSFSGGSVLGASIGPEGEVLGASCGIYLNDYLHQLSPNNDAWEVMKLQMFLNAFIGAQLVVDGEFNAETEAAVKEFQQDFNNMSLEPWYERGFLPTPMTPTGYVYKTTKWTINNLLCPGVAGPLPTSLVPDTDITDQQ